MQGLNGPDVGHFVVRAHVEAHPVGCEPRGKGGAFGVRVAADEVEPVAGGQGAELGVDAVAKGLGESEAAEEGAVEADVAVGRAEAGVGVREGRGERGDVGVGGAGPSGGAECDDGAVDAGGDAGAGLLVEGLDSGAGFGPEAHDGPAEGVRAGAGGCCDLAADGGRYRGAGEGLELRFEGGGRGEGAGFVEDEVAHPGHLFHDQRVLQVSAGAPEPPEGAAVGEGEGEGQGAWAGHYEGRGEGVPRDRSVFADPKKQGGDGDGQDRYREVPGDPVDRVLYGALAVLLEGIGVPKPGQGTLLDGAFDEELDGAAKLPPAGFDRLAGPNGDGVGLAGDERTVDLACTRSQRAIRRHNLPVVNADPIARRKRRNRHRFRLTRGRQPQHADRKPALVIALVRQLRMRGMLVPLADEQEEGQTRQRVEIPHPRVEQQLADRAHENHDHAEGNRHVHVQPAGTECLPSAFEIPAGAVQQDRQGQGEVEPAESGLEATEVELFPAEVVGERNEHDVAEAEARHSQPRHMRAVLLDLAGIRGIPHLRRVAEPIEQGCERVQGEARLVKSNAQFLAGEIHFSPRNGLIFCRQFLQERHARSTGHVGNEQGGGGPAVAARADHAVAVGWVFQMRPPHVLCGIRRRFPIRNSTNLRFRLRGLHFLEPQATAAAIRSAGVFDGMNRRLAAIMTGCSHAAKFGLRVQKSCAQAPPIRR